MATIIARFAEAEGYALGGSGTAASFADGDKISGYAKDAVDILSKAGILSGRSGGVFAPQDSATRAECSKVLSVLLYKLLENMVLFDGGRGATLSLFKSHNRVGHKSELLSVQRC